MNNQRQYYSKRSKRRPISSINIVPYIDVMLVLLMVFMITTPLLNHNVKVQLPKAKSQTIQQNNSKPIVVTVNKNGQYFINNKHYQTALSANQLTTLVSKQLQKDKLAHATPNFYVRGDSHAKYGDIVQAMVILQKAGASHVGLVTQAE